MFENGNTMMTLEKELFENNLTIPPVFANEEMVSFSQKREFSVIIRCQF